MKVKKNRTIILMVIVLLLVSGCATIPAKVTTSENKATPTPFQPVQPTFTPPVTATPVVVNTPIPTPRPTRTRMSTRTPSATIVALPTKTVKAGSVLVPILLYHHVSSEIKNSEYSIDPATFKKQMHWLADHGYATINVSDLARLIENGGTLPKRAVIITFDDGYVDVYRNAYPILQELGFSATFFVIAGMIDEAGNLGTEELQELIASGWEIGSHSMSHFDLNQQGVDLENEVNGSKRLLEEKLGVRIKSFAYPYGLAKPSVITYTEDAGYTSAVGLGFNFTHTYQTQYYLNRYEIKSYFSLDQFTEHLPWGVN